MRPSNHLVSAVHIIYGNYLVELMLKRICIYLESWRQSHNTNDENQEENDASPRMRM